MKFLSLFIGVMLFGGVSVAYAATNHVVMPRVIDRSLTSRDIITETVTVKNNESYKITLYPSVNQIASNGGDIMEFITEATASSTAALITSWIEISRAPLELLPGEEKSLPLTIRTDPNTVPGKYQAYIGFGSGENRSVAETMVKEGKAPGVVMTLTVDSNKTENLALGTFFAKRFVTDSDTPALTYKLANTGDLPVVPQGEIIIYTMRGREVKSTPVNNEQLIFAPGQESLFEIPVSIEGMLGKYKAYLSVSYGKGNAAKVTDTAFFYAVPFWYIVGILGFFASLFFAILYVLLRQDKKTRSDHHDANDLPLYRRTDASVARDHDLNLKQ